EKPGNGSRHLDPGPLRPSHRKKIITITAGISGPHQRFRPKATSVWDPRVTSSRIDPAQASALAMLSNVNLRGRVPAYAQATGMATRKPGRNRLTRMIGVSCEWTRADTVSRCLASRGKR